MGDVKMHCNNLRKQISLTDDSYEKEKLQNRIAKLSGGVAIIKVGSVTETEMKEKKLRLEDAINATKAAVEEGIVPGGGTTYAKLALKLRQWGNKNLTGGELVVAKIDDYDKPFNYGYDALKNNYVSMYETGIIDPAKVTRAALQNATSIAAMVLTTECLIIEEQKIKNTKLREEVY